MNKFKLFSGICLCAGIAFAYLYSNQTEEYSDMILSNVEALASDDENIEEFNRCRFDGPIKCPEGGYAKLLVLKVEDNWELF